MLQRYYKYLNIQKTSDSTFVKSPVVNRFAIKILPLKGELEGALTSQPSLLFCVLLLAECRKQ